MVWYSHLLKNFPQFIMISTVKGFSIVSEAVIYCFLNFLVFSLVQQMLATSAGGTRGSFHKSSLNIWKSSVHVLLKPSLKDF